MRKFKVTLEGRNLHLKVERVGKHGVLVVRFVEAIDEVLAGHVALEDFRHEPKWNALQQGLLNTPDDPAQFGIAEVVEIEGFDRNAKPPGLIFYPEDSDDDTESRSQD